MLASEAILLKRFTSNGDAEAFAQIVEQHAPLVYGVCLRILADKDRAADAVQDTFLQLVRDAADISSSLPNWLHRVATHRAIDIIRADSLRKQGESKYAANPEIIKSKHKNAAWHEISTYLDQELEKLDDQVREILILRFFENKTTREIAKKCGISHPTVLRRIDTGIVSLRHKLKSRGLFVPAAMLSAMLTENMVKAAPAFVMKELGKIAIAGGQAAAKATGSGILASLAVKAKIITTAAVIILAVGSAAIYYNSNQQIEAAGNVPQTETTSENGLLLSLNFYAPERATITVTDQQGNTLSGLKVTEFVTGQEYITDDNGRFTCDTSDETLYFYAVDKEQKLVNSGRLYPGQRQLQIRLEPGRVVSGQVVDTDGKPVSDTQVVSLPMTCFYVLTDNQGNFDVGWLSEWEPGENLCLMARNVERNLATIVDINPETIDINIELFPALTVTGTVEDINGTPIPGATVGLSLRKGWACGTPVRPVISDQEGRYEFRVLPQQQEYINTAETEGYWQTGITTGTLNNIKDQENIGPIILKKPNMSISGVVVDEAGKPVAECPIGTRGYGQPQRSSTTDAEGKFKIDGICSGYIEIWGKLDNALYGTVEAEAGQKDVELVVSPIPLI